jgi:hypothetical protein
MNKTFFALFLEVILLVVIYLLYCGSASFINLVVVLFVFEIMIRLKHLNFYLLRLVHIFGALLLSFFIYFIFIAPCSSYYISEVVLVILMLLYYMRIKKGA